MWEDKRGAVGASPDTSEHNFSYDASPLLIGARAKSEERSDNRATRQQTARTQAIYKETY